MNLHPHTRRRSGLTVNFRVYEGTRAILAKVAAMMEFARQFDEKTDLIYGIGVQINRYVYVKVYDAYPPGRMSAADWQKMTDKKTEEGWAINTFNTFLNNSNYKKGQGVEDYESAISKSSYAPKHQELTEKASKATLSGREKRALWKSNTNLGDSSSVEQVRLAAIDLSIRRSCKFGIEYVTQKLNGRIHYVLDSMDLGALIDKSSFQNSKYDKVPICTSELRFLFRNWEKFKTGKVVFWEGFKVAKAPWDRFKHMEGWRDYALQRMEKNWSKICEQDCLDRLITKAGGSLKDKKDFKKLKPLLQNLRWRELVEAFHSIPVIYSNKELIEIS